MKINLASVFVDDQDKALSFYTQTLGFVKKTEMPVGEFKWLTVVSTEDPDGVELVLEPDQPPGGQAVQKRNRRRRSCGTEELLAPQGRLVSRVPLVVSGFGWAEVARDPHQIRSV